MAKKRKKISKAEIHKENIKQSYEIIAPMVGCIGLPIPDQVKKIVSGADSILKEICQNADYIKIDLLESVQDIAPVERSQWIEFVQLAMQVTRGSLSDKRIESLRESFEMNTFRVALRKSFFDTYVTSQSDNGIELPIKEQDIPLPNLPETDSDPDFETFLKDAIRVRSYINDVLWPAFRQFAEAAEHITNGDLTYFKFKDLVDYEHYKDGGYPTENSKPKLWTIINRFNEAARLMSTYEFEQIQQLFNQFGLHVTFNREHPSKDTFSDSARALSAYEIIRPKDDNIRQQYRLLEDEHIIIITPTVYAVYDIDTRVIRVIRTFVDEIDREQGFTADGVKESFDWLCLDEHSNSTCLPLLKTYFATDILHPSGDVSKSKRCLTTEDLEILGPEGYYGDGTNPDWIEETTK